MEWEREGLETFSCLSQCQVLLERSLLAPEGVISWVNPVLSTLIILYRRKSLPHSPSWSLLSPSQVLSYLLCPITTLSAGIGEHGGLRTWFLFWSWNKHGLLIAVFRLEIYLTKQFHSTCSSLLHILLPTSTMWNNYSQTSLQVTVPKLADIFLVYIV